MLLKPADKTALMLWLHGKDSIPKAAIFLVLSGIPYKYNKCHTTLGGLSHVCVKLASASCKNNEILEVNILQKFTPYALFIIMHKFFNINVHCSISELSGINEALLKYE